MIISIKTFTLVTVSNKDLLKHMVMEKPFPFEGKGITPTLVYEISIP